MASDVTLVRPTTPLQDSTTTRVQRDSQDSSSDTDFSSIVAAALNPPQNEDPSTPGHLKALRDNMNVHTHITGCMHSLKDIRAYIQAMALCQEARSNVGAQIASPRIIVNTFTEYCADHPRSFLALVCNPALNRILQADPTRPPTDALSQILSDYLGRPLPDVLRFREVNAFINELEHLYQSQLHRGYEVFFSQLLSSQRSLTEGIWGYAALEEPQAVTTVLLTLEDIARIIRKCYDPRYAHLNILNRTNWTLSVHMEPIHPEQPLSMYTQPLALLTGLQHLTVTGLTGMLNLPPHPELGALDAANSHLIAIDLSHTPAMCALFLRGNQLTEIDLRHTPAMHTLDLRGNQLTEIDLGHTPAMHTLDLTGNQLPEIDLSRNPAMWCLGLGDNQLREIDLRHTPAMYTLDLTSNQLPEIDLSHNPELSRLDASENLLAEIDLSHNPELRYLDLANNRLVAIDLSHNPQLTYINLLGNPNLRRLDLRNNPLVTTVLVDPGVEVLRA